MNIVGVGERRVFFAEVEDEGTKYLVELTPEGYSVLVALLQNANTSAVRKIKAVQEAPAPVEVMPDDLIEKLRAMGVSNETDTNVPVRPDADLTTVFGGALEDDGVEEL